MIIEELLKDCDKKMNCSLDHLKLDLAKLRTGKATLSILDDVRVDYYGNPTPLNQVANLGAPDNHTLHIQPWDSSIIKDIEKAIQSSDLGLTPSNDGKVIRLPFPPLTGERRQQLAKLVKKHAEDCKVAIRNVRRESNDRLKGNEKKHEISEDDSRKGQDRLQKLTDKFVAEADKIAHAKEKDILET